MSAKYLLGVDIGSSNMKTLLIDERGRTVGSHSRELFTSYPHPGWAEQDPAEWLTALCESVHEIFEVQGCDKQRLAAICITAATHTAVLLDKNDKVLRPAILWTDGRSKAECDFLNEKYGNEIFRIAYHRTSPTWTFPQFFWLKRNEPALVDKIDRVLFAKDYLRYLLTGLAETEVLDGQGSMMMDFATNQWSEQLCGYIDWPIHTLPPIMASEEAAGAVTAAAAAVTGLPAGVPIVRGASDTALEDYGAGAIATGQGIIKIATAGNANIMISDPQPHPLLFNYKHPMPGMWYIVAGTLSGAQVHKWLRDQFFVDMANQKHAFASIDALATQIPPGSGGLIFHPYLMGEKTPYFDPLLRGDYLGITIRHSRAHFVRALYEGISFSILDCLSIYKQLNLRMDEVRLIGGGANSPLWRQILCDIIGQEILVPANNEAAFGAALLAGVGVGVFSDPGQAVERCCKVDSRHEPNPRAYEKYQKLFEIYLETQRMLAGINHKLYAVEMESD